MTNHTTLILGGIRSGKSRLAEKLALESGLSVSYIATATAEDEEMQARIAAHRLHRPSNWHLVEEPLQLASAMREHATTGHCIIVDCLTLWLTNLLTADDEAAFEHEYATLLDTLPQLPGQIILVGNETNMGIIPLGELSRRFCDQSGRLHQELAQICERVILTIAGLPMVLKEGPC
ncbi:MAG: bifunctional adenosylcobinamide kinase/adenosylcobinamide-phosphate guanylyltransferase [Gammaproteobacteria bacterium]|nr:bifunctional adenosylcobinamide kinase/adenosylcobinamide-phosphate guanylyltransferase [Gammaproteobacteria bacterium]